MSGEDFVGIENLSPDTWCVMIDEIEGISLKYGLQIGVASKTDENTHILLEPKEQTSHLKCLRCGKRLKSAEAQARGYGKICWEKHQKDRQSRLF